ncbi:unnamed protein product [Danaus chrysippus]|uniref:(African queen) hypothetical protein n=1 Tax=Danaus chrysippus TaxID=151541 RepID=A0A8J2QV10_9NEOP|nr:unnamed protein product [Danaus chrysippus]
MMEAVCLEGLTDLGGSDSFAVTGNLIIQIVCNKKEQSKSWLRLGGGSATGLPSSAQPVPNPGTGPPGPEYHEYGSYPTEAQAASTTTWASPSITSCASITLLFGYHPGPDPMYWRYGSPGLVHLVLIGTHLLHQVTDIHMNINKKMHQYPPQQAAGLGGLQPQNGTYIPRQPHFFPQPSSQQIYGATTELSKLHTNASSFCNETFHNIQLIINRLM